MRAGLAAAAGTLLAAFFAVIRADPRASATDATAMSAPPLAVVDYQRFFQPGLAAAPAPQPAAVHARTRAS